MGVPLYITSCFSLVTFNVFVFSFSHFNYSVSWCGPYWVDLVWDSLCFLDLYVCFFSQVMFSARFFSFCDPYNVNVSTLGVVSEISLNCPHF